MKSNNCPPRTCTLLVAILHFAVVEIDRRGEDDPAGLHGVHEAGLPDELAPPEAGGEAGPGGDKTSAGG